jgi:CubicO group peptidase (beta-lactamase class C family)
MNDWIDRLRLVPGVFSALCRVPEDLEAISVRGAEVPPEETGLARQQLEMIWQRVESLYRTGTHPAIQICVRHRGRIVLHRAIGHATGNAPEDPPEGPRRVIGLDTPINIFSASKAVTAMIVHKLDERGVLRLDDWVCEYIPAFAKHGKHRISIRHVLAHRAGIPNLPQEGLDLDLLGHPDRIVEMLCDARLQSRPGRLLAYHAVSGGFVLAEVMKRASGRDIRELLRAEISGPLGARWLGYGVAPDELDQVAQNAFTGPPVPPPLAQLLRRALGAGMPEVVRLSNDPRFLLGVIPSANVMTTAEEISGFYQCLLDDGSWQGQSIFAPRSVHHAIAEQSYWEMDFTLGVPLRYGLGFMLGSKQVGPFGLDNERAFGHIGLSNTFTWADPDRQLAVALLTTGKPVVSLHVVPLFALIAAIGKLVERDPRAGRRGCTGGEG